MRKTRKEFVYIVGDRGPEHNHVYSAHKYYEGALKEWEKLRRGLLGKAKQGLQFTKEEANKRIKEGTWQDKEKLSEKNIRYFKDIAKNGDEMYLRMIKSLSEKNPKKIDNYPHETPHIFKIELK